MTERIQRQYAASLRGVQPATPSSNAQRSASTEKANFQRLLESNLRPSSLKFSTHAQQRLERRQIHLDGQRLSRLEEAVEKAAQKGARESLVLIDDLALVVSVKNRTVITAVDEKHLKEKVFTNIDSAIIV
jgi:flagellar operon protein